MTVPGERICGGVGDAVGRGPSGDIRLSVMGYTNKRRPADRDTQARRMRGTSGLIVVVV